MNILVGIIVFYLVACAVVTVVTVVREIKEVN